MVLEPHIIHLLNGGFVNDTYSISCLSGLEFIMFGVYVKVCTLLQVPRYNSPTKEGSTLARTKEVIVASIRELLLLIS